MRVMLLHVYLFQPDQDLLSGTPAWSPGYPDHDIFT